MATVERPPTMPAVYHAALIIRGPPRRVRGAMTAPITPYQYKKTKRHINTTTKDTYPDDDVLWSFQIAVTLSVLT